MSVSKLGWSGPGALFFSAWYLSQVGVSQLLSFFCLVSGTVFFLVTGQVSGPGAHFFFCFVSEPGWRGPGALFFFSLVSEPGAIFFPWFLAQVRGVAADGG